MPNATALAAEYVPRKRRASRSPSRSSACRSAGRSRACSRSARCRSSAGAACSSPAAMLPIVAAAALSAHPARVAALPRAAAPWPRPRARVRGDLFAPEFRRDTLRAVGGVLLVPARACISASAGCRRSSAGAGLGAARREHRHHRLQSGRRRRRTLGGALITRFGSRVTMLPMAAGAAAARSLLGRMPLHPGMDVLPPAAMLAFTGGLINAVQTTMFALAAHVYPTAMRSTGVGTAALLRPHRRRAQRLRRSLGARLCRQRVLLRADGRAVFVTLSRARLRETAHRVAGGRRGARTAERGARGGR